MLRFIIIIFHIFFFFYIEKADTSSIVSLNEHQSIADTDIDEECFHDVMEVNNLNSQNCINNICPTIHIKYLRVLKYS